jgi:hypothetical protein
MDGGINGALFTGMDAFAPVFIANKMYFPDRRAFHIYLSVPYSEIVYLRPAGRIEIALHKGFQNLFLCQPGSFYHNPSAKPIINAVVTVIGCNAPYASSPAKQ